MHACHPWRRFIFKNFWKHFFSPYKWKVHEIPKATWDADSWIIADLTLGVPTFFQRQVDTVWLKVKGSMPAGQSMSLEFPLETRQEMGNRGKVKKLNDLLGGWVKIDG